jgi:cysteinyl-tRNA synthetase
MIKIFNTLGRKKQEFVPLKEQEVKMYQCGPTVYWMQHIGNLRATVLADLIRRSFEYLGYNVIFARNYTDVGHLTSDEDSGEDKMDKGAKREGLTPREIADKYINIFEHDARELNVMEPNFKPLATNFIKEMIEMVEILLEKGFAYTTDLAVYFDISKVKDYTKLSGQKLEENISGAGKADIGDPGKKNPADFSIWFFKAGTHKNSLQFWKSPFKSSLVNGGEGFPGWHMECSAMVKKLLGTTLHVHMGGIEHIPVHHTNEIAQSEAANNAPLANYWLHNEHLNVDNGKMSKSTGTAFSLSEIKEKGFSPLDLRFFYLQAHYRSKQNFTWDALKASQSGRVNLTEKVKALGDEIGIVNKKFKETFVSCISDDFNITQALSIIYEVLKSDLNNADKRATILDFDKVFGLSLDKNDKIVLSDDQLQKIKLREQMRKDKNYTEADRIRKELLDEGIEIEDSQNGTITRKIR